MSDTRAMLSRDDVAILLAWATLPIMELYLAWSAMVRPSAMQIAFELVGCTVLALAQVRLAKGPLLRSPIWPAVLVLAGTAMTVGPDGLLHRVLYIAGAFALGWRLLTMVQDRTVDPLVAVLATAVAAVGGRWLVLSHASELEREHLKGAVAVSDATSRLVADLTGPLDRLDRPEAGEGPPLVLITVDTLRADSAERMRAFGRVAEAGKLHPRAMSTSSWTLPAMASALTGQPAVVHGADARPGGHYQGLSAEVPTVTEQLSQAGYATAAFVTNPWLESSLGFSRGFDHFLHANEAFPHRLLLAGMPKGPLPIEAEAVVDRAIGWVESAPERGWFLWVHLLDPHMPYLNAAPGSIGASLRDQDLRAGKLTTAADREAIREAYEAEVDYTDAQLNRLLDALEARGVLERGLVLLTADHGEEFWDHGFAEHGHAHYTEVVDVPLAVGGLDAGGPAGGVASLVDVAPTLRAAAGLPAEGIDLRHPVPEGRIATAYGNNYYRIDRSARVRGAKLILRGDPVQGDPVLSFDRRLDPTEQRPLPEPDVRLLRAALAVEGPGEAEAAAVNREALEALGYLH